MSKIIRWVLIIAFMTLTFKGQNESFINIVGLTLYGAVCFLEGLSENEK